MSRVLVVDDEDAIRDGVRYLLATEGIDVVCRDDGISAVEAATSDDFDLIVLDVMLGDVSGIEVVRRVRVRTTIPILLLTARDAVGDRVEGLDAGADDYLPKPYDLEELLARLRALLRRSKPEEPGAVLRFADLTLDLLRYDVSVAGRAVQLTPIELRIVAQLADEDRAYSRRELLAAAWDTSFVPDDRSCDGHIANIRRKLEDDPSQPRRLLTVRGVGYRLSRS